MIIVWQVTLGTTEDKGAAGGDGISIREEDLRNVIEGDRSIMSVGAHNNNANSNKESFMASTF